MKRMVMWRLAALAALAPAPLSAQSITIRDRGQGHAAAVIDSVTAHPHAVHAGSGTFELARGEVITTSLVVVGQDAYVAGRVQGDVVVVGGNLFLRPGVDISGRAVAIGGTVAQTTLGHVGGSIESLRDETFDVQATDAGGVTIAARSLRVGGDSAGIVQLSGFRGVLLPHYDRVDGLSLPVGLSVTLGQLRLEPSLTYRSRLGVVDPAVAIRVGAEDSTRFEGRVARDTRSNDRWITSELVNSLKTLAFGTDTRNYFRSDIAEGRFFLNAGGNRAFVQPFVGGRFERVSPITAVGNVYSVLNRSDSLHTSRPNPLVQAGHIASLLGGVVYETAPSEDPTAIVARLTVEAEQGLHAPAGTSNFTQLTADGRVEFATFRTQRLRVHAHAVGTAGDSVPRARYAYLGGSGTLALADLLSLGGDQLVFVDSRYLIPIPSVVLPVVGSPVLGLIHRIGGDGVGTLGTLQQEVGAVVSLGPLDLEVNFGASGQARKSQFGVSVNLPAF